MKRRKAVSVLLVMAMAASMLTGCGGGNTNTTGTNGAASTEGGSSGENTNDSSGVKEFTAFLQYLVQRSMMTMRSSRRSQRSQVQNARETWLTGQTAQEAVGTLIAGGEYPDMIDGGDGMKQLYDAGALVALDDYIDKYPNIKEFLQMRSGINSVRMMDISTGSISLEIFTGKKKQPPTVTRHSGSRREC